MWAGGCLDADELCDGLDPNRDLGTLGVNLGAASDVADCKSKCVSYG